MWPNPQVGFDSGVAGMVSPSSLFARLIYGRISESNGNGERAANGYARHEDGIISGAAGNTELEWPSPARRFLT